MSDDAKAGSGFPAEFQIAPRELGFFAAALRRPECVLCTAAGDVVVSHWEGGVTHIRPDGTQRDILAPAPAGRAPVGTNGFAITPNGEFLLADLHPEGGGAWRLRPDGSCEPFLTEIEGRRLPPANFVGVDRQGRAWVTVSTWHEPRAQAYRPDVADGFIILVDGKGPRIVAEQLGYTNEAIVAPSGEWLYVNETFARRTSRLPIAADGSLGPRETYAEYGPGTFPDGLAFDEAGGVWITSVISNRVIRVDADGSQTVVLEDNDPEHVAFVERVLQDEGLQREHMDTIHAEVTGSISSIAFGGADRKTAYLGNLLDDKLYTFPSPVAGAAPSHWNLRLSP
jgi:sugar lactone lactonase YvrE